MRLILFVVTIFLFACQESPVVYSREQLKGRWFKVSGTDTSIMFRNTWRLTLWDRPFNSRLFSYQVIDNTLYYKRDDIGCHNFNKEVKCGQSDFYAKIASLERDTLIFSNGDRYQRVQLKGDTSEKLNTIRYSTDCGGMATNGCRDITFYLNKNYAGVFVTNPYFFGVLPMDKSFWGNLENYAQLHKDTCESDNQKMHDVGSIYIYAETNKRTWYYSYQTDICQGDFLLISSIEDNCLNGRFSEVSKDSFYAIFPETKGNLFNPFFPKK
ncbi:MAG: hypothetical protein ACRCYO_09760 [Bacteroidia bacterium]